jgi:hypothetical protein
MAKNKLSTFVCSETQKFGAWCVSVVSRVLSMVHCLLCLALSVCGSIASTWPWQPAKASQPCCSCSSFTLWQFFDSCCGC